jgi:hypothetical protein
MAGRGNSAAGHADTALRHGAVRPDVALAWRKSRLAIWFAQGVWSIIMRLAVRDGGRSPSASVAGSRDGGHRC